MSNISVYYVKFSWFIFIGIVALAYYKASGVYGDELVLNIISTILLLGLHVYLVLSFKRINRDDRETFLFSNIVFLLSKKRREDEKNGAFNSNVSTHIIYGNGYFDHTVRSSLESLPREQAFIRGEVKALLDQVKNDDKNNR